MNIGSPPSAAALAAVPQTAVPDHVVARLHDLSRESAPVSAYLYDPQAAAIRARSLRAALPEWVEICYAVKANAFAPVLAALAEEGVDGFEVASISEAQLATRAAAVARRPARLLATGPAKTTGLLAGLCRAGVGLVNVESDLELYRLSAVTERAGRRVQVALRVNPQHVPVSGSLHLGGTATQFGIPEDDIPAALETARRLPGLDVVGFHIHAVCNNLDADAHAAYLEWCLKWCTNMASAQGVDLRVVDVGGGLGVAFQGEQPFDIDRFGSHLRRLRPPKGVRVVLEPGRWLVADCGYYAAEVVDVKQVYGTWFAVLRGGINHFQLPTSWDIVHNFAVLPIEAWPYGYERPGVRDASVTVVGELCTTEDTLARDVTVGQVRAGDIVVFPYAGAYGWEFAMHRFLGHPPADRISLPGRRSG